MSDLTAPLRRLPIPLPPVKNETSRSYIARLATVNHLEVEPLEDLVSIGKRPLYSARQRPVDTSLLSQITGYSSDRLSRALPDMHQVVRSKLIQTPAQSACPRCVRRHQGGRVKVYLPEHHHLCVRHNVWFGSLGPATSGWAQPPGPVDVSAMPAIRAAQRRHHRLVHCHGESNTNEAVSTAREIWDRMNQIQYLARHEWEWLRVFRPGATRVSHHDPLAEAIRYPAIITIASVLVSPHWRNVASDWETERSAFTEIARRLELYDYKRWGPSTRHPLSYWASGLQQDRRRAEQGQDSGRIRFTEHSGRWRPQ